MAAKNNNGKRIDVPNVNQFVVGGGASRAPSDPDEDEAVVADPKPVAAAKKSTAK